MSSASDCGGGGGAVAAVAFYSFPVLSLKLHYSDSNNKNLITWKLFEL